jgi:hypothetical protein
MPATKHRRRGKARPRWVPPPRPPHRQITEEERREDALLVERLQQLFGPPSTIHQGGDIDWWTCPGLMERHWLKWRHVFRTVPG